MPIVRSNNPDRMYFRSGGKVLIAVGIVPLLVGIFPWLALLLGRSPEGVDTVADWVVLLFFCSIFFVLGFLLVFFRAGKDLDRQTDSLVTWWGMPIPVCRKAEPLSAFQYVRLNREVRNSEKRSYIAYPVYLARDGGHVKLEESLQQEAAYKTARAVAKFLALPLHDVSLGSKVVRAPDELDESIRERFRRTGKSMALPTPPEGLRCQWTISGDTIRVTIPPPGLKVRHAFFFLLAAGVAAVAAVGLLRLIALEPTLPGELRIAKMIVVGLALVLAPFWGALRAALHAARRHRTVDVSPRVLRVRTQGALWSKVTTIPVDALDTLMIVHAAKTPHAFSRDGQVILARSSQASVVFGDHLSARELEWLNAIVHRVIVSGSDTN